MRSASGGVIWCVCGRPRRKSKIRVGHGGNGGSSFQRAEPEAARARIEMSFGDQLELVITGTASCVPVALRSRGVSSRRSEVEPWELGDLVG